MRLDFNDFYWIGFIAGMGVSYIIIDILRRKK